VQALEGLAAASPRVTPRVISKNVFRKAVALTTDARKHVPPDPAWFDLTQRRDNFGRSMITVTDNAVHQLRVLLEAQRPNVRKGLRVQIAKGGCSGLQYEMSLDDPKTGDSIVEREGVEFLVDSESADYLRGATLDYREGLTGTGFHIENPNAARTCGCGTSFEAARPA
jgi:iron-sulfur cluster assembly accessory protein